MPLCVLTLTSRQAQIDQAKSWTDHFHAPRNSLPEDIPETYDQMYHGTTESKSAVTRRQPDFVWAPTKDAGSMAYLGESSNYALIPQDHGEVKPTVHYSHSHGIAKGQTRLAKMDTLEVSILRLRGAFILPPRALCDDLVHSFFQKVAPILPVINRNQFMRQYHSDEDPPSMLLLQSLLLAGSRVCTHPDLRDSRGSTHTASTAFYDRAKALYDTSYENDRTTIVQALTLMTWFWSRPEGETSRDAEYVDYAQSNIGADVTKNVFYWTKVAVVVAQAAGMHRR